jgi:predicted dehydrogenase
MWHKEWAIMAERMTGRFTSWNEAVLTRTQGEAGSETVEGTTDPFVAQLVDVAAAISERRQPYVPLREGAASLRLALMAVRSGREGRELRLAD